jgi:hypothetical protein
VSDTDGGQSPIPEIHTERYQAFIDLGRSVLVRASLDGRDVTVIAAVVRDTDNGIVTGPLAVMLDDDQLSRLVAPGGVTVVDTRTGDGPDITA